MAIANCCQKCEGKVTKLIDKQESWSCGWVFLLILLTGVVWFAVAFTW